MKKLITILSLAALWNTSNAQLSGGSTYPINGTLNPPSSFGTIQDAATYLATSGVTGTGDVVLELQTGYSASSEPSSGIYFDTIAGGNSSRRVTLRPATGFSATISGAVASAGLLNLRGTQWLTIDGRQGGTGSIGLTFSNSSSSATDSTSTIRFHRDARNNSIRFCGLVGASKSPTHGGVLLFSRGVTTGNTGNFIGNCTIDGSGLAHNGICSNGTAGSSATQNQADTISGCQIFDYFNSGVASNCGINLSTGTSAWVITGNSIYQTTARAYTLQAVHYGIFVGVNWTSDYQIITNNFIGGSGPNATGNMALSMATANAALGFLPITTNCGNTATNISGNTIKNITMAYASTAGSFTNAAINSYFGFNGAGGTVRNNTIDSLLYSNATANVVLYGIYVFGRITASATTVSQTVNCNSNTIRNLTVSTTGTNSCTLYGIRMESSSAASITSGTNVLNVSCDSNTVSNLLCDAAGTTSLLKGLYVITVQGGGSAATLAVAPSFNNNLVENLRTTGKVHSNTPNPVVVGIQATPLNAVNTVSVQRNVIRYLRGLNPADTATTVTGIYLNNGIFNISRNRIYDLTTASSGVTNTPYIMGINVRTAAGAGTISNNHIALGAGQSTNSHIYCFVNNANATQPLNIYNNTFMISGSASGNGNSACVARAGDIGLSAIVSTLNLKNNLLINKRSGGTGGNYAIAAAGSTQITGGHNTFIAGDTATMAYFNTAATGFGAYVAANPTEAYSYYANSGGTTTLSTQPAVVNTNDLLVNNGYDSLATFVVDATNSASWLLHGKGLASTLVPLDFYGTSRSTAATAPISIGAQQFTTTTTPPLNYVAGSINYSDSSLFLFAGREVGKIRWGNVGTLPSSVDGRYYSGKLHPSYPSGNVSASYWTMTATGGSAYEYTPVVQYGPHEIGTISNSNPTTKLTFYSGTAWNDITSLSSANTSTLPQTAFTTSAFVRPMNSATAFALTDNVSPVPVEFLSFDASCKGRVVNTSWTTASEINNSHFEIQRSGDGEHFDRIGTVAGAGNSSSPRTYSFADAEAVSLGLPAYYYRLKQVDLDGKYIYSNIVKVAFGAKVDPIQAILPNPFDNNLSVSFNLSTMGKAEVKVVDMHGRVMATRVLEGISGLQTVELDEAGSFAPGVYHVVFTAGEETSVHKIVKMKN